MNFARYKCDRCAAQSCMRDDAFSLQVRNEGKAPSFSKCRQIKTDPVRRRCEERLVHRSSTSEGGSDEAIRERRMLLLHASCHRVVRRADGRIAHTSSRPSEHREREPRPPMSIVRPHRVSWTPRVMDPAFAGTTTGFVGSILHITMNMDSVLFNCMRIMHANSCLEPCVAAELISFSGMFSRPGPIDSYLKIYRLCPHCSNSVIK
jgi:hypothetical protein